MKGGKRMKVKVIMNNIIPPKSFLACTIWPFIFCRRKLHDMDLNHEIIHAEQQEEMLILPFFIWYGIEWLIRLIIYRNTFEAYRNISFEQEAYLNQHQAWYTSERCHFAWIKYLTRKTFRKTR
jgi:hypothetical protein